MNYNIYLFNVIFEFILSFLEKIKNLTGRHALKYHMETIHPKYDGQCASCEVDVGPDWESHLAHANLEHQGLVRRKCYLCVPGIVFDSKQEFNSHR